jgi:hypothetical protein
VSLDEKPSALLSPFCSKRTLSCDATSVTRWDCEKIAQNVAQPIICQN